MVKETVRSIVGATAPVKTGTSVAHDAIPVAFDGLGKMLQEFIKSDTETAEGTVSSSKHSCGEEIESELLDVVEKVMLGTLTASQFVALLKSVNVTAEKKVVNVSIANVLWLWGTQTDPTAEASKWKLLAQLVKDVAASGLVDNSILETALEFNLLAAATLLRDDAAHQRRLIKVNTNLFFKQQKYNLLREETEGFSKLNVMLCNEMPHSAHTTPTQQAALMGPFVKNVFSVVGRFDLEPNRVLDLILDAFEEQPLNLCFIPLIDRFRHGNIAHIIGFKFTMFHLPRVLNSQETEAAATGKPGPAASVNTDGLIRKAHADIVGSDAPQSLYILAAQLIIHNLVDLQDLLPYLRPSLDKLVSTLAALEKGLNAQVASYGVVSLNNTSKTASKDSNKSKPDSQVTDKERAEAVPVSVDVSKETAAKPPPPGRRPAPPLAVPVTGATVIPAPPALRPPVPPAPPAAQAPVNRSASAASLGRTQSSGKLAGKGSGTTASDAVVLSSDEEIVPDSQFALFHDPAYVVPPSGEPANQGSHMESGEVTEVTAVDEAGASGVAAGSSAFAEGNEIVGLIAALVTLRGWHHAKYLLNLLEMQGVDPLLVMRFSHDLRGALAAFTQWQLEQVYQLHMLGGAARGFVKPVSILPIVKSNTDHKTTIKAPAFESLTKKTPFDVAMSYLVNVATVSDTQLQQISTLADFPTQINLTLSYLGYHVREYPALYARLCHLSRVYVMTFCADSTPSEAALEPVVALICNVLLPGLSAFTNGNPSYAGQVWSTISPLPFAQRFAVYDRWYGGGVAKEGQGSKHAEVVLAETIALHGARAELKRLAKENTKAVGLKLARYTQTSPLVVFNHVLSQVEAFDNLIPYIVDALKYCTDLSQDVMAYSLISQLKKGASADAKLKKGDTHFSQWFSALTKFIATFYCRYPTTELKGLLNYLLQRMSIGDSLDLLVLKELLGIMGSSETLLEVSPAQLEGLSGGRSLRGEVMGLPAGVVSGKGMITVMHCKRATTILRDELVGSHTAIPLLLMIAQVRSRLLHDEENTQLKLISHLYDTAQDVLMQFTEFLVAGARSIESIAELMPDLSVLLGEVGLAVPVAFQLVRPLLRAALQYGVDPTSAPARLQRWHPFGETMTTLVRTLIQPASLWDVMSPRFYVLFWGLGLYDIKVPVTRYETEIKRLKDKYADLDHKKNTTSASSLGITPGEFSKLNRSRDLEMKQLLQKIADLTEDLVKQKKHVEQIRDVIRSEQATFFHPSVTSSTVTAATDGANEGGMDVVALPVRELRAEEVVSENIMQHLLYQRLLMSPLDAVYCTQLCFLLHEMQTPLFSTLDFLDRTVRTITPLIFCSTESEASFVGYALLDLLQVTNRWHDDEVAFNNEARDKLGLSYPLPASSATAQTAVTGTEEGTGEGEMEMGQAEVNCDHTKFKELCKEWHTRMFSVIKASFKVPDREYIYIRSGLVLLAKVSEQFPSRAKEGDQLIALVEQLVALETKRGDLQIMAKSLITILKKRADSWLNDSPQRKIAAMKKEAAAAKARKAAEQKEKEEREAKEANKDTSAVVTEQTNARSRGAPVSAAGESRRGPGKEETWRRGDTVESSHHSNARSHEALPSRHDGRDGRDRDGRDSRERGGDRGGNNASSAAGRNATTATSARDAPDAKRRSNSRDRDRRGAAVTTASNSGSQAPTSGVKRKNEEDRPTNERNTSASTPHARNNAKVDESSRSGSSAVPISQGSRDKSAPFVPTDSKKEEKEKDRGGRSERSDRRSAQREQLRDPKDPREPLSSRGNGSSSSSGAEKEKEKDKKEERSSGKEKDQSRDSATEKSSTSNGGREDRRDNRQQDRPATATGAITSSSNKRSREAADLPADAASNSSSNAQQVTSNKRGSSAMERVVAPPQLTTPPIDSQAAQLLEMKMAARGGSSLSQGPALMSLTVNPRDGGKESSSGRRDSSRERRPSQTQLQPQSHAPVPPQQAQRSQSRSHSELQLSGSNTLFPAKGGNASSGSGGNGRGQQQPQTQGRFDDRPPRHQQQQQLQSGSGRAGYDDDYHQYGQGQGQGQGQSAGQQGYPNKNYKSEEPPQGGGNYNGHQQGHNQQSQGHGGNQGRNRGGGGRR